MSGGGINLGPSGEDSILILRQPDEWIVWPVRRDDGGITWKTERATPGNAKDPGQPPSPEGPEG